MIAYSRFVRNRLLSNRWPLGYCNVNNGRMVAGYIREGQENVLSRYDYKNPVIGKQVVLRSPCTILLTCYDDGVLVLDLRALHSFRYYCTQVQIMDEIEKRYDKHSSSEYPNEVYTRKPISNVTQHRALGEESFSSWFTTRRACEKV
jgi:hypothetical protein